MLSLGLPCHEIKFRMRVMLDVFFRSRIEIDTK